MCMKKFCSSVFCTFLLPHQICGTTILLEANVIEFFSKCCQGLLQDELCYFWVCHLVMKSFCIILKVPNSNSIICNYLIDKAQLITPIIFSSV